MLAIGHFIHIYWHSLHTNTGESKSSVNKMLIHIETSIADLLYAISFSTWSKLISLRASAKFPLEQNEAGK